MVNASSISAKAARVDAGLSQSQVAERLRVGKSTVSRWENGQIPVSDTVQEQLSRLYGLDREQIKFGAKEGKEKDEG